MKKRLAAAITTALVVGVASTTFAAANPFVDVPAKHWSYDAVTKLAQAGIVDGYGDGTFRGDKTITRYEMAQIVAKAMTKSDKADAAQKAAIDKLAVEYAAELNNLGVRVAKLEASQSNIKFTGDARLRYINTANDNDFTYRLILGLSANVNDSTSFSGKLMTDGHQALGDADAAYVSGANDRDSVQVAEMALTTKDMLGTGSAVTAGRFSQKIGTTGYFLATTGMVDGIKASFGNKVKVTTGFANFKNAITTTAVDSSASAAVQEAQANGANYVIEDAAFVSADYNFSKATALNVSYLQEQNGDLSDYKVYSAGVTAKFAPGWTFTGEYLKNVADRVDRYGSTTSILQQDPYGYVAKIGYKGANFAVKDSWGATVEYFKFEDGVLTNGGDYATAAINNTGNNREGYSLIANYALAKNVVVTGVQTFNSKTVSTGADRAEFTRVQLDYKF